MRIFSAELTDYERYACDFGYALNVPAGEDVRVLRRGEHAVPEMIVESDFWLVDNAHVIPMHYDIGGRFLGAELLPDEQLGAHRHTRDVVWAIAEPFTDWWARHPERRRHAP